MTFRASPRPAVAPPRCNGLSLVELMVALLLGSLLMIALVVVFLSGRSSFLTQEQVARMQENGRYAFDMISRELHTAGYRHEVWDAPNLGGVLTAATVDGGGSAPDTLEFQFESDRDCLQAYNLVLETVPLPGGTTTTRPRHDARRVRFTVVDDQLHYQCSYGPLGGTMVTQVDAAIADGVENLQVQYGEDRSGDVSVNRWVDAGSWSSAFDVVAIRLALVVRTPETFATESDTQVFDLYGASTVAAADRRIRKVYSGQVNLRNLTL